MSILIFIGCAIGYMLIGAVIGGLLYRFCCICEEVVVCLILFWGIVIPIFLIIWPIIGLARWIGGDLDE